MIYRIAATVALLGTLLAAVHLSEGTPSTSAPAPASVGPDDSAMKSLRIE